MKLSEMRAVLAARNLQLTRSLGQNFLHDGNQLRRIVGLAEVQPGDRVLEVGPGLGPLTGALLEAGARVLAVEKDARLVAILEERFGVRAQTWETRAETGAGAEPAAPQPPPADGASPGTNASRLQLIHADALRVVEDPAMDWTHWKLVANLPYSVASPILVELANAAHPPERLVATLQLEVVHRLMARPDCKDYGILTLLVQCRYEPRGSFKIPADCFFPAPDVESGCVALVRRHPDPLTPATHETFVRVVKRAFSERRKKALKLLKFDWPAAVLEDTWAALGLDPLVRAENLTRDHFLALSRRLTPVP